MAKKKKDNEEPEKGTLAERQKRYGKSGIGRHVKPTPTPTPTPMPRKKKVVKKVAKKKEESTVAGSMLKMAHQERINQLSKQWHAAKTVEKKKALEDQINKLREMKRKIK